jgi:hypothetical protein
VRSLHTTAQAQAIGAFFIADAGTTRNGARPSSYQCAAGSSEPQFRLNEEIIRNTCL